MTNPKRHDGADPPACRRCNRPGTWAKVVVGEGHHQQWKVCAWCATCKDHADTTVKTWWPNREFDMDRLPVPELPVVASEQPSLFGRAM